MFVGTLIIAKCTVNVSKVRRYVTAHLVATWCDVGPDGHIERGGVGELLHGSGDDAGGESSPAGVDDGELVAKGVGDEKWHTVGDEDGECRVIEASAQRVGR